MEEEISEENVAVPRFASFRPKQKAPREQSIGWGTTPDNGHDQGSHRRLKLNPSEESSRHQRRGKTSHHEHQERHRHHHHRRQHRSRSRGRTGTVPAKKPAIDPEIVAWDDSPEIYHIDTKGDPKNLAYGAIHQYSLPTYHRAGAGNVIGLDRESKIVRELSSEKGIVIQSRFNGTARSREKYAFSRNERKGTKKLRIKSFDREDAAFEATLGFIPLRLARGMKRERMGTGHSSSGENDDHHYRSIEGKAKAGSHPEDRDLEFASESSASDYERIESSWDETARQRNIELSQRVEADPTNVDAWLELVNHQDNLTGARQGRRNLTSAERLSTADVKLSMYEKALNKVGNSRGRERLLVGLMEEGGKIWDFKKLSSKWQTMLQENPGFIGLWTKYLDFRQTKSIAFRYEDIRKVYVECIGVLRAAILNATSSQLRGELEDILIYVLLRGTLFMREAENAIATWQALLELHFFAPTEFVAMGTIDKKGEAVLLSSLERFWESEVPRIGEDGAEGWDVFAANGEVGNVPEPRTDTLEAKIDPHRVFETWITAERLQALQSRDPARTIDEVEEDDPYRVILFSDIKDFLTHFGSKQARWSLLNAFMMFCRLPPLPRSSNQSWWTDSFVRNDGLEQSDAYHNWYFFDGPKSVSKETLPPWPISMEFEHPNLVARKGPFAFKLRNFPSSAETLFGDDLRWFALQDRWLEVYPGGVGPVKIDWLRRVLKSLASRSLEYNLAEYYLAFEWRNFPEGAKKVAKSLLKKDRTNLHLYNSYALLEWRSGNISTAVNVFVATIEMSKTLDEAKQRNSILLWKTWVWELLQVGDLLEAWQKLLCISEGKATAMDQQPDREGNSCNASTAAVLRARRYLDDGRDSSLALGYNDEAVHFVECSAILEYLFHSRDADAATAAFRKASEIFDKRGLGGSTVQELLHQGKARLLHLHATMSRSFKPSTLRDEFAQSIRAFPRNTIFLSLFLWNEARSRIDDRVRSIMTDVVLKERQDTIIGWIFSIWTELKSAPGAGYNANTVRATFERAVSSGSGKCNPSLWKLFVEFECQQGGIDKAKAVFYRGLKGCPWSKVFAFLAFKQLRNMGFDELRNIYRVLGEKELRIHVDLEDNFDAVEEGEQGAMRGAQPLSLPMKLPNDTSTDED
ncbi:MAG: hypothetical protein M1839_004259 [Geoglossum umbratile]|nr:MAG: hypothetical protein M1839_004259 [Geoglossum umbratile]